MLRSALLYTALLFGANAAFAGAVDWQAAKDAGLVKLVPAEESAPVSDVEFTDPDGGTHTLADYRGKVVLLNFWATWCAPCREEFPDLVEIRGQYGPDTLDFVLVSLDDPSDIGKAVPEFLAEARATAFPSYLLNADDSDAAINLVDPTWSGELPATFLYDRSGALVFKHKGRVKPAELRDALDEALKE